MVLFVTAVTLLPAAASAETGAWSTPVSLSGGTKAAWWPDIAADNAGNVYVVWNGLFPDQASPNGANVTDVKRTAGGRSDAGRNMGALYIVQSSNDGGIWSKPNDIALVNWGLALRSSIAVDGAGWLHMVYKGLGVLVPASLKVGTGQRTLWYTTAQADQAGSVGAWFQPRILSHGDEGYYSDMAIDRRGVIHVIITDSDATGTYGLYYTHSSDGGVTWSPRVALDRDDAVWWYRAQLKVDELDRLHVVWEIIDANASYATNGTVGAFYAQSSDGGLTWKTTRFMAPPAAKSDAGGSARSPQEPAVGADAAGNVLFVYRDPDSQEIMYLASRDGSTWSAPVRLPGIRTGVPRPYDQYDMATDSAGHVHLVAVAYATGSEKMALFHWEWDGQQWGKPQVIVGSPLYPEYPRIAIGRGNQLSVTWFDRNLPTTDGIQTDVWYSTARTNAPPAGTAQMPSAAPTVETPAAVVTTVPTPEPTTVRTADFESNGQVAISISDRLASFKELQTLPLFAALFSAVGLLSVVLIARRARIHV